MLDKRVVHKGTVYKLKEVLVGDDCIGCAFDRTMDCVTKSQKFTDCSIHEQQYIWVPEDQDGA